MEQTILKHPAVRESTIVGIPDQKWRERPKAFATLKLSEELN
ncbi:MAG: hypothetical protein CMI18_07415 [Opitutaceae bacterium]|nr:hypothetical protein [Opitutaceae bacterium]